MLIGIDASRAFGNFFGGPESYSYNLIRSILLSGSKHIYRLYVTPEAVKNPRFRELKSDLTKFSIFNFQFSTIAWPRLWTQGGLALECLKNPPDVLFVPAHTLPIIRRPGLKTVVTIHDLGAHYLPNYHKFPQKYYLNTMTDYAIKNATRIIAVSQNTKRDIVEKSQISNLKSQIDLKIRVIYEGYDREVFYPRSKDEIDQVRVEYGLVGDYLLFVGTIQPRKNLVRLIQAFSQLISKLEIRNSNLTLVLAGAPGWLNEEIYTAPHKYGVAGMVKFLGSVDNAKLPALISGSKAFVFPSLYEGFGLAPLEALACGVPTILSNTTSLPEVGGEAAFYVDPLSIEGMAQRISQVLNISAEYRLELVKKNLEQSVKFSWEKAALETLKVIEETLI